MVKYIEDTLKQIKDLQGEEGKVRSWELVEDRLMAEGYLETCEHKEIAEIMKQCCRDQIC